jgi:hypothetical protein
VPHHRLHVHQVEALRRKRPESVPQIVEPERASGVLWLPVDDGALGVALARLAAAAQVRTHPALKPRARAR